MGRMHQYDPDELAAARERFETEGFPEPYDQEMLTIEGTVSSHNRLIDMINNDPNLNNAEQHVLRGEVIARHDGLMAEEIGRRLRDKGAGGPTYDPTKHD